MSLLDKFPKRPGERDIDWIARLLGDEAYLQAVAQQKAEEAWAKGIPVWRADEKGIFNLHKDGTKEYVRGFEENS